MSLALIHSLRSQAQLDERVLVARLHRRAGFGLAPTDLDAAVARGAAVEVERLVDADAAGLPATADPWSDLDLTFVKGQVKDKGAVMIDRWLTRMRDSARPAEDRIAWLWHGILVSAMAKVKVPQLMANQIRLFWRAGLGPYATLIKELTVDPAMLLYLDGTDSTKAAPNENYGRELMELFTLGRDGGYTEADVQAAARALTGWHVRRARQPAAADVAAQFDPKRHDDSAQTLVGLGGVHDATTVVAAVTGHPSCARYVAGRVARAIIGPSVDSAVIDRLATQFRDAGLDVRTLLRAVLGEVAAGNDAGPVVLAPVPWLLMAEKALGVTLDQAARLGGLRAAGQIPLDPPNVGGWPSGPAWFSSAAVVARFNLASTMATMADAGPSGGGAAVTAARAGDPDALARALGLPATFGSTTSTQLAAVADAPSRLVIALTSPEFVLA